MLTLGPGPPRPLRGRPRGRCRRRWWRSVCSRRPWPPSGCVGAADRLDSAGPSALAFLTLGESLPGPRRRRRRRDRASTVAHRRGRGSNLTAPASPRPRRARRGDPLGPRRGPPAARRAGRSSPSSRSTARPTPPRPPTASCSASPTTSASATWPTPPTARRPRRSKPSRPVTGSPGRAAAATRRRRDRADPRRRRAAGRRGGPSPSTTPARSPRPRRRRRPRPGRARRPFGLGRGRRRRRRPVPTGSRSGGRSRPRRGDWGESIGLAVNPVGAARVEVDAHPAGLRAEVPCGPGPGRRPRRRRRRPGRLARPGRRGSTCAGRRPGVDGSLPSAGAVDGLYLWDALPAGDRVRARLTYRDPGGTAVVRLGLGPGVLVRECTIPGAVDVSREGTADRPEWVARVDPPLPDGATVSLDVFRPRGRRPRDRRPPATAPARRAAGRRAVVRRPGLPPPARLVGPDRAGGRLRRRSARRRSSAPGGDAPRRAADPLRRGASSPASPGAALARRRDRPAPPPGSGSARRSSLTVVPGRIDLALDADLTETAGPVHEVEIACPDGFRVVRVVGRRPDRLVGRRRRPPGLRLRFDGPPLHQRRVRVEGWIAVAADPLAAGAVASTREVAVPWPRWPGQDERPGTLDRRGPGRGRRSSESPGPTASRPSPAPSDRVTYRVTRPDDPAGSAGRSSRRGSPSRCRAS